MKRKFIIDEEIALVEGSDLLNTKVYVDNLADVITNAPEKSSFTVGLFGEWGTGKSSIIKTVQEKFKDNKTKKIIFIKYDAWKYSNDSFRRMFLLCLKEGLDHKATKLLNSFYLNESEDVKIDKKFNYKSFFIVSIVFVLGIIVVNNIPSSKDAENWKFTLSILISFFGLLSTILFKVFDDLKINIQKPHMFAPEQFEDCYKEMVGKSLKHENLFKNSMLYVKGDKYINSIDRIVIVIDNIDRCHKEMAFELLTNIKNFLGNPFNVIFVIPVDDTALRKHILGSSKNGDNESCDKEAEEFLRKFFNVTVRIKPYHTEEMYDFAEKLNQKYELTFKPSTIDIVSKEYARNQRRIIQFFNNLTVELNSYPEDFSLKYETIICKLLIIREEFPDYFNKLSQNSYLLHNGNEVELKKHFKIYPDLDGFLNSTRVVSQKIPQEIIERILSNSNVFSGITGAILQNIKNIEIVEILGFIKDDDLTRKAIIVKYLIENLKKGLSRGLFDSEVIPKFDLLTALNKQFPLDYSENIRVFELLQDVSTLNIIFEGSDILSTIFYCKATYIQGIPYLTNHIIEKINEDNALNTVLNDRWNIALHNIVHIYTDESILEKLSEPFKKSYLKNDPIIDFKDFTDKTILLLISPTLQIKIIDQINQINETDHFYSDFSEIVKRIEISEEVVLTFFKKINLLYPNFNLKTDQDINLIINDINICLNIFKNGYNIIQEEIQKIFNVVVLDRMVPHPVPQYASNRANDQSVNYVTQIIGDPLPVLNIVDFCKNVFRLTLGSISILDVFNKILSNTTNRSIVNKGLVELMDILPLTSFFDLIIADTDFTEDSQKLLKYALCQKQSDVYELSDNKVASKLTELLSRVFNDDLVKNDIILFLEDVITNKRVKELLIGIISKESKRNIYKLTSKLQSLSIDAILNGDSIFNLYSDNIEFLKVVASNGEPKHIKKLVGLLMTKLQVEATLNDAISILMEIKRLNIRDASRIKMELENYQTSEEFKDSISQAIDHISEICTEKK